ncbi:hypothetical protein DKX38_015438 [Salix brachista]|uniref:FAE domain-containing protein n=1 Tax=Salix brachista TaxID=2182728 RepID=A0A5N5L570_9ROSI|nr:hypothetical protein DKX38_015438 [Salix brachista]
MNGRWLKQARGPFRRLQSVNEFECSGTPRQMRRNKSLLSQPLLEREKNNLPNTFLSVKLKYVKLGYHYLVSNAMYLTLMPVLCMIFAHLSTFTVDELWNRLKFNLVTVLLSSTSIVFTATLYFMSRPKKVYLVDFSCYKPGPSHITSRELFMQLICSVRDFHRAELGFSKENPREIRLW